VFLTEKPGKDANSKNMFLTQVQGYCPVINKCSCPQCLKCSLNSSHKLRFAERKHRNQNDNRLVCFKLNLFCS